MKIITYNVNGLRAAVSKGLPEWLEQENPDILCLQETKNIRVFLRQPFRETFGDSSTQAVHIISYNLHHYIFIDSRLF